MLCTQDDSAGSIDFETDDDDSIPGNAQGLEGLGLVSARQHEWEN